MVGPRPPGGPQHCLRKRSRLKCSTIEAASDLSFIIFPSALCLFESGAASSLQKPTGRNAYATFADPAATDRGRDVPPLCCFFRVFRACFPWLKKPAGQSKICNLKFKIPYFSSSARLARIDRKSVV